MSGQRQYRSTTNDYIRQNVVSPNSLTNSSFRRFIKTTRTGYRTNHNSNSQLNEREDISGQSLSIRIQKKIFGKLSNKYLGKLFLDNRLIRIVNNIQNLCEGFCHNRRTGNELRKGIIKTMSKIHVLILNNQFNDDDNELFNELQTIFQSLSELLIKLNKSNSIISRYSFRDKLKQSQNILHQIIKTRLTRKSHQRIDFIFDFISNKDFLIYVFDSKSPLNQSIIQQIIDDIYSLTNH